MIAEHVSELALAVGRAAASSVRAGGLSPEMGAALTPIMRELGLAFEQSNGHPATFLQLVFGAVRGAASEIHAANQGELEQLRAEIAELHKRTKLTAVR